MPSIGRVALKAIVVGIVFALLFGTVHAIDMVVRKEAAMTHVALAFHALLAGTIGHVAFEVSGMNRWYAAGYK